MSRRRAGNEPTGWTSMRDLSELVTKRNATYSPRYSEALLDELMPVGDPVADAAIVPYGRRVARRESRNV